MSSFFVSLRSCLEDYPFRTFSNSSACIANLSMIALISLLRFVQLVPMLAIILASILVSVLGNRIFRASLFLPSMQGIALHQMVAQIVLDSKNLNLNFLDFT